LIGAMTCHAQVAESELIQQKIPALAYLAGQIGDAQVRNRGTLADGLPANIGETSELLAAGDYIAGQDLATAAYEWNYPKQMVAIRLAESSGKLDSVSRDIYGEDFLIERPLLAALRESSVRAPVLLIDEIDRSDEHFEAFLLELLSDFQISIPELGTISATVPPIVIFTVSLTRVMTVTPDTTPAAVRTTLWSVRFRMMLQMVKVLIQ